MGQVLRLAPLTELPLEARPFPSRGTAISLGQLHADLAELEKALSSLDETTPMAERMHLQHAHDALAEALNLLSTHFSAAT